MANAIDAASARMACALAAVTDLVVVSNVNHDQCSMDVNPEDAMSAEKKFSDLGIQDTQMPFLVDALARCCPEDSVRSAVRKWPVIPAAMIIVKVVGMLEAELLKVVGWNGRCMGDDCCK